MRLKWKTDLEKAAVVQNLEVAVSIHRCGLCPRLKRLTDGGIVAAARMGAVRE